MAKIRCCLLRILLRLDSKPYRKYFTGRRSSSLVPLQTSHIHRTDTDRYRTADLFIPYIARCYQMIDILGSSFIITLKSSSPFVKIHLHLSEAPKLLFRVLLTLMWLTQEGDTISTSWFPVNSWLCAWKFRGSSEMNDRPPYERNLFVIPVCVPTDCSSDTITYAVYQQMHIFSKFTLGR